MAEERASGIPGLLYVQRAKQQNKDDTDFPDCPQLCDVRDKDCAFWHCSIHVGWDNYEARVLPDDNVTERSASCCSPNLGIDEKVIKKRDLSMQRSMWLTVSWP